MLGTENRGNRLHVVGRVVFSLSINFFQARSFVRCLGILTWMNFHYVHLTAVSFPWYVIGRGEIFLCTRMM